MAMFLSPIRADDPPTRRAWDNATIHDGEAFYAFFNTTDVRREPRAYGLDVARSTDGVHWEFIARDLIPIAGAHAGYGILRVGGRVYYYPTVTDEGGRIHLRIYSSTDYTHWEHLGDEYDVVPDSRYYAARWEEMCILRDREGDREVFYGYISAEIRDDVGQPSLGIARSYDGIAWEVLPPPVIEWGELPAQHMEVNFCERMDGRYYLSLTGRLYLDSYGYSAYTFVADSPTGPFRPDLPAFRMTGTSRRDVTWLTHVVHAPDGPLVALWLSARQELEIPSHNMGIGPLKRLIAENGHLRLAWWPGNEAAKAERVTLVGERMGWIHPAPTMRAERDTLELDDSTIVLGSTRDGGLVVFDVRFDAERGFLVEGRFGASEHRGDTATHQHAASAGFFLESGENEGYAIVAETLGVTRGGTLRYADHRITDEDVYAEAGTWLVQNRSGRLRGLVDVQWDDQVGPFGHAPFCGIRHDRLHGFRLVGRGDFVELYVDDYYVQTYLIPLGFTGRIGLLGFDGVATFADLVGWRLDL